ncbi:MAG: bacteriohemerythrin [Nitrospirota bacterium]|nr:bacteriohemerythrin [Nitrospirota bacterium]
MSVQWTPDLGTEVNEIDDQHKELFKRIDSLLEAWKQGKAHAEVDKVINFLTEYVVFHFGNEEKYMVKYGYTNKVQHLAQHDLFVKTFGRLKEKFMARGANAELIEEANQLLVDWLKNHIKYSDKALGLFLKRKM